MPFYRNVRSESGDYVGFECSGTALHFGQISSLNGDCNSRRKY